MSYTVEYLFFKDIFTLQSDKDFDPFADRRRPTIAEREDEYKQKRRKMIISPERVDPFADGEYQKLGISINNLKFLMFLFVFVNASHGVLFLSN